LNGDNKRQIVPILFYIPLDAAKGSTSDTDIRACAYKWVGRKRRTLRADAQNVHFVIIEGRRRTAISHKVDDPQGLKHGKPFVFREIDEDIAREKRVLDLPANTVLPPPRG
jgi:hypothetical protein